MLLLLDWLNLWKGCVKFDLFCVCLLFSGWIIIETVDS